VRHLFFHLAFLMVLALPASAVLAVNTNTAEPAAGGEQQGELLGSTPLVESIPVSERSELPSTGYGIVDFLMRITLLGSVWVLYLLLILSIISVAIMIERAVYFQRNKVNFDQFMEQFTAYLNQGATEQARAYCATLPSPEAAMAVAGLSSESDGVKAVEKSMTSYIARIRSKMDKGLVFLGTMGNNAPFIGLFGTVLGIIQAFHALSLNPAGGPAVVMAGISEALIATAVGLFVAIPAVIAFNYFQRIISERLSNAEAVQDLILKHYAAESSANKRAS